jgi:glycolate oxidase FAD binding subunit
VGDARAASRRLALSAGGTKARIGRHVEDATPVDLSLLRGIVTYEPEELILIAAPATPLREVETLLAERGQHLAFEPPRWGAAATLGGTLGCGWSGPRRFHAGAARDFVLGVELVDGRGRRVRAGGRVVKNVTGYDLWRTTVGAYGTLGALTEVCLKLWPQPETERTVLVEGLSRADALERMREWSRRPEEITGLAVDAEGCLLARIEGPSRAVRRQADALCTEGGLAAVPDILEVEASRHRWAALRDAAPYRADTGEALWRLAVPPTKTEEVAAALEAHGLRRCGLDWGGGLLWAVLPAEADAVAVHGLATGSGGVASRVGSGPEDANPDAFSALPPGLAKLNSTLKAAMDPEGLLNPGRMFAGQ